MPALEDAIQYIRMGNSQEGRLILEEILETDENDENVWLWLSAVVESDEDREICLENVLALNPNNAIARRGIDALQSGTFDINELFGDVLEAEADAAGSAATFLDDFVLSDDSEEELEPIPGTPKKKAKKKGGGINIRLVILALLVVLLVLVLGGVAAFSFFMGGGEDVVPVENPPAQETPVQSEQQPEPTPTDTPAPTPLPTDTPTPTPTRLGLPTPKPTDPPTPVPTRVVSPTPNN